MAYRDKLDAGVSLSGICRRFVLKDGQLKPGPIAFSNVADEALIARLGEKFNPADPTNCLGAEWL